MVTAFKCPRIALPAADRLNSTEVTLYDPRILKDRETYGVTKSREKNRDGDFQNDEETSAMGSRP